MKKYTKTQLIGIVLKALLLLFFLFDSIAKILKHPESVKGSVLLGVPETLVPTIGIVLLCFTSIYAIPRFANFGALLLTAFLGGATSVMIIGSVIGHPYFFPIIIAVIMWLSQALIRKEVSSFFF